MFLVKYLRVRLLFIDLVIIQGVNYVLSIGEVEMELSQCLFLREFSKGVDS